MSQHFRYAVPLRKSVYFISLALTLLLLFVSSYGTTAYADSTTTSYVDPKLGFGLQIPNTWQANTYTGSNGSDSTSGVEFTIPSKTVDQIGISVIRNTANSQNFAARGKPTLYIGNYPAFEYDTPAQQQFPEACLVRVMLAGDDLVSATWCGYNSSASAKQFEQVLATYQTHAVSNTSNVIHTNATVNPVESCSDVINTSGSTYGYGSGDWGTQQGNPTDAQWTVKFNPGASVCDNFISGSTSYSGYLFQCVELANRFIREQWGMTPGFTVNAQQYYDYYQGGKLYQGQARTLFGNNVQLSDDASQGTSSFAPTPGDLLVWQTVNNPSQGWTSGIADGTAGHVAVITNVDATHVYIAQQNYSEPQYYATLSLTKVSNGWSITGLPFYDSRTIVRGWIHFNANPYSAGSGSVSSNNGPGGVATGTHADGRLELFQVRSDGNIWHQWETTANGSWQSSWSQFSHNVTFAPSTPAVSKHQDGRMELFALDTSGNIWHQWETTANGSWQSGWSQFSQGVHFASSPTVILHQDGRMELFATDTSGNIWHQWEVTANGTWQSTNWVRFSTNINFALAAPNAALHQDGRMEVFAVDASGKIWHQWETTANGSWQSSWVSFSQNVNFVPAPPAIHLHQDGRMELFAVDTGGDVWHQWEVTANGTWQSTNWVRFSTNINFAATSPRVALHQDGRMEIFAVDTNGKIWHQWETTANGSWQSSWNSFSSGINFAAVTPSIALHQDGRMEIFAVDTSGKVWHQWETTANGNWQSSWSSFS